MALLMVLMSFRVSAALLTQGLSSTIDVRVGVEFPYGNSSLWFEKARLGELFCKLDRFKTGCLALVQNSHSTQQRSSGRRVPSRLYVLGLSPRLGRNAGVQVTRLSNRFRVDIESL